jgi:3-phytase
MIGRWQYHHDEVSMQQIVALFFSLIVGSSAFARTYTAEEVTVVGETEGINDAGDSDDPAIWINQADVSQSRIYGTYKEGGVATFNLAGELMQWLPGGEMNNIDVRQGVYDRDVAVASDKSGYIHLYEIDPNSGLLRAERTFNPGVTPYGVCLGLIKNELRVFITTKAGPVREVSLTLTENGNWKQRVLRDYALDSKTEGCVVWDRGEVLFVGEEERGVWRFHIGNTNPQLVAGVDSDVLTADVEGLALWPNGRQLLLVVSSQGSHDFALFDVSNDSVEVVGKFRLVGGGGFDDTTKTDGIELSTAVFSDRFSGGIFIAHDDSNAPDGPNFKLANLGDVAARFGLTIP